MGETLIVWSAVERLGQTGDHLVVRFSGTGWVLPLRCFEPDEHRKEFVAALKLYVGGPY